MRKIKKIVRFIKKAFYLNRYYKLKIDNKLILLESKHGADLAGNIFYILKELRSNKYREFKIVLVLEKKLTSKIRKLLAKYDINDVEFVEPLSLKYYKYLASAKFLFNDTSFPTDFIKKEAQIYLNTWHGTPLKKMGRDVANRAYGIGNVQKNFLMADYLLYPNDFMKEKMLDSYMIEGIYNGKIMCADIQKLNIL